MKAAGCFSAKVVVVFVLQTGLTGWDVTKISWLGEYNQAGESVLFVVFFTYKSDPDP